MKPHLLEVYLCGDQLYVVPSLPSRKGLQALDALVVVEGGWHGLELGLREGEHIALNVADLPESQRPFGNLEKLLSKTGCKTFRDLVKTARVCSIGRFPDFVLVDQLVPGKSGNSFEGENQLELPADTSLEKLARIARTMLEKPSTK